MKSIRQGSVFVSILTVGLRKLMVSNVREIWGQGEVAEKPSESGNNTHFQRHSCPGPDFMAEKGKKGIFSRNFLLKVAKMPFSAILNTPTTPAPLRLKKKITVRIACFLSVDLPF
jgi:hypothetical protein